MNPHLTPQPGELRATIHITRAATGETETVELVGHSDPDKLKEILARHHGASGALVSEPGGINIKPEN